MESGGNYRQTLGRKGEEMVCDFLEGRGHTILERNYRSGHLEIDIISFDAEGIHFVEVKTRRLNIQAPPQDNVAHGKQQRIARAAMSFLKTKKGLPFGSHECFFDVAAVTFDRENASLEWFPQAYIPTYF
ncbi:MAG: YraN family protein [Bacteroidales bacterium]|nr:YraN family protein [Bacteroidales bacterium]